MELNITVRIKSVYGINKIYPVCNKAKNFASLANTQTLTDQSIQLIKALGYTINVEQEVSTL